ncbi:hypothetical protein J2T08_000571 [Neorhizobium galegae]|uniref:hyaluronate lyase N-terminal domain-containing protein n=1 Tax=Neorhizobium galegae TaxID=399 RepID=UPI002783EC2F|nr:hypothetical protein [Neorhizobium galegae]MDQ0132670.1 hypothetical protein [Neorhizobium galegae]
MSTEVRHRRGTTAQHAAFTGALAEITVDTDKKTAVVHDGATVGGFPLAREDGKNDGAFGYQQDVKTNDYAVVVGDIGKMLVANKATAINFTLGTAAALTSKFIAGFKNIGVGVLSITPNGAELIDGANAAITLPAGGSLILKGDGTSFRTFVSNGDVTGAAIHNAATKAALADADEMGVIDTAASNVLKKLTLANLITSIFKTARTIANAQFDSASFKLFNAAGTPRAAKFDNSAMTADCTLTLQNRDMTVGVVRGAVVTPSGTSVLYTGIPDGITEFTVHWIALATSATARLCMRVGPSSGVVSSGYVGELMAAINTGMQVISSGTTEIGLDPSSGSTLAVTGRMNFTKVPGATNLWRFDGISGSGADVKQATYSGYISLANPLDRFQITTIAGTATLSGTAIWADWKY